MARHGALTKDMVIHRARAYDVLVWVLTLGKERGFRERIVDLAHPAVGTAALDVGCGTGSLAIAAKARVGATGQVSGSDPSPEMVARARRKAAKAGADIPFEIAGVEALPFADDAFDVVFATLMLHHLTEDGRRAGIGEIARVLKPGGRFLAVDIGGGAKGHRHGLFLRIGNHAHFDLDDVAPVLESAGLQVAGRGPVTAQRVLGLSNLRYLLAEAPSP